jgi:hypothetical protein
VSLKQILLLLLISAAVQAQTPVISAAQPQGQSRSLLVSVSGLSNGDFTTIFETGPGAQSSSYRLYAIEHPDEPEMRAIDVTGQYIAGEKPVSGFGEVTLALNKALRSDTRYLLVVSGVGARGRVIARIDPKATVAPLSATNATSELKVSSPVALASAAHSSVTIERSVITNLPSGSKKSTILYPGEVSDVRADGIVVTLFSPLPSGKASDINITGLADTYGNAIEAKAIIDGSGAPASDAESYILLKIGSSAAVHQKPVFTLSGAVAPLHPASRAVYVRTVRFDPSLNFDIGLNTTKSANSVVFPAAFSHIFIFGLPSDSRVPSPDFTSEKTLKPWAVNMSFGPRMETDRTFNRFNPMGELRAELYLASLFRSGKSQRTALIAGNPSFRDLVQTPTRGFEIAPYIQADVGGHANEETVAVGHSSVLVPAHQISRLYLGAHASASYGNMAVDLDGSWANLFSPETIGYTTKQAALLRTISGWQPHVRATATWFVDTTRHYGFTAAYEDGRTAPNFEYLNKVDAGFKVVY